MRALTEGEFRRFVDEGGTVQVEALDANLSMWHLVGYWDGQRDCMLWTARGHERVFGSAEAALRLVRSMGLREVGVGLWP